MAPNTGKRAREALKIDQEYSSTELPIALALGSLLNSKILFKDTIMNHSDVADSVAISPDTTMDKRNGKATPENSNMADDPFRQRYQRTLLVTPFSSLFTSGIMLTEILTVDRNPPDIAIPRVHPFMVMDKRLLSIIDQRIESNHPIFGAEDDPSKTGRPLENELLAFKSLLERKPRNKKACAEYGKWRRFDLNDKNQCMKLRRESIAKARGNIEDFGIGDCFFADYIK
ncbi:uncharacterized protein BDR25DRAFT_349600 [Lindgomyces ingoldianus]|uniref:Uncharacterized protein n=1 Tax=Lindgomyces ingoldianus TaxID=673940 RepID=A0ACB6RBP5_9PLEO|nr:uncharacterized protein BDR25DRAFT_349600 [Lindgomyces ingoldianus]KAF2476522.1 hypothetical protein BDR25DRAFT_349600 [Lindgomyces ingoldianus]